jgi:hypothetical protein
MQSSIRRLLAYALCFLLVQTALTADAFAITSTAPPPNSRPAKVVNAVAELGAGEYSLVAMRLANKGIVKGRITEILPTGFVVADNDTGVAQRVAYSEVVKLQGYNLRSGKQARVGVNAFKAGVVRGIALVTHRTVVKNSLTGREKTLLVGIIVGVLLAIILAKVL